MYLVPGSFFNVAGVLLNAAVIYIPDRVRCTNTTARRYWCTTRLDYCTCSSTTYLRFLRRSLNLKIPNINHRTTPTARGCITQTSSTINDRQRSELFSDSRRFNDVTPHAQLVGVLVRPLCCPIRRGSALKYDAYQEHTGFGKGSKQVCKARKYTLVQQYVGTRGSHDVTFPPMNIRLNHARHMLQANRIARYVSVIHANYTL